MTSVPERPMRADAQRNYDRILAAAEVAFARDGAEASLEEIARQAGVGSATLHRHFPARRALLEAVFRDRVQGLCARAEVLAGTLEPGAALVSWLQDFAALATANRGLAASVLPAVGDRVGWHAMISEAGGELLRRAQRAGAVRNEVGLGDLLTLVSAISLLTEQAPDGAATASRLLTLALDGIHPR
ncbi:MULTISPECIES: TetR/AcrR family transcriptional regulator [unclassified Crossiella]|uniref:TetR/AcrR family transcriptional regulator n=1 Tax=unclassified Crossiella TaxID=2620835 RepID=UPI001FFF9434|nr:MULTISPECIES: TetR/AcrR family transcriptional regulator [unclassified Crossiella]MCK2238726.1 TetR/AcrR family transcriptional regulator [Crossiella sp. S99.2]MCK2251704.1 TetR/AcrR family transcriptional regulator [Crossiella sp. S99.1]